MDATSSAISASQVHTQILYAIASKRLDAYRQEGDAIVDMLESAARLSKENGLGQRIDTRA